jgi:hypothetical protein
MPSSYVSGRVMSDRRDIHDRYVGSLPKSGANYLVILEQ